MVMSKVSDSMSISQDQLDQILCFLPAFEEPGRSFIQRWAGGQKDADGAIQSTIKLRNDGSIEINGDTDNAVAWTDLNTAFELLKTEIFVELGKIATGLAAVPYTYAPVKPTAEISGAKVETVKLP